VAGRERVVSADGTEIAYWATGQGPPLLLVHGSAGIHERFEPLLPYLEPHATVFALDRRGRGSSGDAPDYDLAREFEDVAAVVDAIAEASGEDVAVYGHSYGGNCAWGATALTPNIRALVLYEGWPLVKPELFVFPAEQEAGLEERLAAGDPEAALLFFMSEVIGFPEEEITAIRAQPTWPARVSTAHTIAREARAVVEDPFDRRQAAAITMPVLVLTGADSPPEVKDDPEAIATALPDARLVVIEGQQHLADVLAPDVFAGHVLEFLRGI
jgi:pimeloyl-ACP methyl ester carboxylesterase